MGTASGLLLVINFICICVALAGIVAGGVGHSWWKANVMKDKIEIGLWRHCTENLLTSDTICERRENVLEFTDKFKSYDIVLSLLIGGAFFGLIGLIVSASMCCCQQSPTRWKCGCTMVSIAAFLAGGAAIAGLVYAEIEITWDIKFGLIKLGSYERGWSIIATWIGAVMYILSFTLSLVLCCIPLSNNNHSSHNLGSYPMN